MREPTISLMWAAKEISEALTDLLAKEGIQAAASEEAMTDSLGFAFMDWGKPLVFEEGKPDPYESFRARYVHPIATTLAHFVRVKGYRVLARPKAPAGDASCTRAWRDDGVFLAPVSIEANGDSMVVGISGR